MEANNVFQIKAACKFLSYISFALCQLLFIFTEKEVQDQHVIVLRGKNKKFHKSCRKQRYYMYLYGYIYDPLVILRCYLHGLWLLDRL